METYYDLDLAGCACDSSSDRSFWTKEERVNMLKDYKKDLDNESKAVSEKIKELEKKH